MTNRLFGRYLQNYCDTKGVSVRIKTGVLALLWITIGLSAFLAVGAWWLRILLLTIAAAVTVHVARLPSCQ
jgi:uncharacterized membrane protein YbaN (DUF454 family)